MDLEDMDFAKNDSIRVSSTKKPTLASNPSDWQFSSNLIFGSDQSVGELKFGSKKQKTPTKNFHMSPNKYLLTSQNLYQLLFL